MMKFAVSSKGNAVSDSLKSKIQTYLLDFGLECDEEEPDIVISVGGDGTLLYAFHKYSGRLDKTAFVGVHTGHLGFYADWVPSEIEKLVIAIAKTPYQIVEYPVLEVIVRYNDGSDEARYLALNECTIKSIEGTLVTDVEIKGELLKRSAATAFVCRLLPEVRHITRRLAVRLFIRPSGRSSWLKWRRSTTGCFGRSDRRSFCLSITLV